MTDIVGRLRKHVSNRVTAWVIMEEAADLIEGLQKQVRKLTILLDRQVGTPCEQIRHEQEIEKYRDAMTEIKRRSEMIMSILTKKAE